MTSVLSRPCTPFAPVSGTELQVPLVHGGTCTYANFDYAASAPALSAVTDRIAELLPFYSSVHRGAGYAQCDGVVEPEETALTCPVRVVEARRGGIQVRRRRTVAPAIYRRFQTPAGGWGKNVNRSEPPREEVPMPP